MYKNLLKRAMVFMITEGEKKGYNSWQDFKDYVIENSDDRRFKPQVLASRSSHDSMIVQYRNRKYYIDYNCITKDIEIEIQ